ncbi:MAG: multicopper oxidase domain-containing protein [Gemmatimonadaceae bacterium]
MVAVYMLGLAVALHLPPSGGAEPAAKCRDFPAPPVTALANDNRVGAGSLDKGVLTLKLVARAVAWRPDGTTECALSVNAFAEEGRTARIPGPLIRIRAGTEVRVTVRNALGKALWLRGLQDRKARVLDSVEVAPGASREFRFVATAPGAWYYWAGNAGAIHPTSDADGALVGALVVDSNRGPGASSTSDRVMVLTRWSVSGTDVDSGYQINAFNGRAWPNTERLSYTVGDSVQWHVINASGATHEMHLHGFYFRTDARGTVLDTGVTLPLLASLMRVTAVLRPGEWMSIAWSPDRPGNWLYHCHLVAHMNGDQRLDRMPGTTTGVMAHHESGDSHTHDDMGGLVMGVDVKPARIARASAKSTSASALRSALPRRSLELHANTRPRVFGELPGFGFVVQNGASVPSSDSIRIPGSPIVLTRDEPVRIVVHNHLPYPISVHWHGIELESYFDGVGGYSGMGPQIAPMIAPKDSFIVRFTPPRAGTFMYHVHGERGEELASGLYGPLVVVEPGTSFDPNTDRVFVFADGGPGPGRPIFINGTAAPDTLNLVAGVTYRLRFIYITANAVYLTTLRGVNGIVTAKQLGLDGHDVPDSASLTRPLQARAGPGHTQDFAFTPAALGNYSLTVERIVNSTTGQVRTGLVTAVPIRVRAP